MSVEYDYEFKKKFDQCERYITRKQREIETLNVELNKVNDENQQFKHLLSDHS